jgi:hypothetical protein
VCALRARRGGHAFRPRPYELGARRRRRALGEDRLGKKAQGRRIEAAEIAGVTREHRQPMRLQGEGRERRAQVAAREGLEELEKLAVGDGAERFHQRSASAASKKASSRG